MPTEAGINAALDRAATVYESSLMLTDIAVYPPLDDDDEVFDEGSGTWVTNFETAIYTGKCHIRQGQARPIKTVEIGESLNAVREWRLRVPRGTVSFEAGCVVQITGADRTPEMVGQRFRVDDWPEGSLQPTSLYMMTAYHPRDHRIP